MCVAVKDGEACVCTPDRVARGGHSHHCPAQRRQTRASLDLLFLHVRPEIGARTLLDTGEIAGFIGGRFGVGTGVVPSLFAHGGTATNGGYWDAGLGVDVTFIPKLEFGAQLATLGFGSDTYLSMTLHGGMSF